STRPGTAPSGRRDPGTPSSRWGRRRTRARTARRSAPRAPRSPSAQPWRNRPIWAAMWWMALPVRLDHCVIHVSDWDVSNAFYRDVVGAELVQSDGRTAHRVAARPPHLARALL